VPSVEESRQDCCLPQPAWDAFDAPTAPWKILRPWTQKTSQEPHTRRSQSRGKISFCVSVTSGPPASPFRSSRQEYRARKNARIAMTSAVLSLCNAHKSRVTGARHPICLQSNFVWQTRSFYGSYAYNRRMQMPKCLRMPRKHSLI
jgi:hypothetical protein